MSGGTTYDLGNDIRAMRAMARVLVADPARLWRRHGIGVLQSYVSEGGGAEVRLHIWHPDLVRPGIPFHGDIHDHRFSMHSTVLHGELMHNECEAVADDQGDWDVLQVCHARENPSGEFAAEAMPAVPGPLAAEARRARVTMSRYLFGAGTSYQFARGHFHRSSADRLVVTVVVKTDQINRGARILSKHGEPPVEAFDPADQEDAELGQKIRAVLADAAEALQ